MNILQKEQSSSRVRIIKRILGRILLDGGFISGQDLEDRPYRPAWPQEKTLQYLKERLGKDFDPGIIEVFIKIVQT